MRFETEIIERSHAAIIRCNGRFVFGDSARSMRDSTVRLILRFPRCILCFEQVTQIDAWGVGVLAELHRMAGDGAGSVVIAGIAPAVRETLQLAGLLDLLQVSDSTQAALAALPRVA